MLFELEKLLTINAKRFILKRLLSTKYMLRVFNTPSKVQGKSSETVHYFTYQLQINEGQTLCHHLLSHQVEVHVCLPFTRSPHVLCLVWGLKQAQSNTKQDRSTLVPP